LRILKDNASLFEKITSHTLKGTYHNQLALVLRSFATSDKRNDLFREAIQQYESADHHFKLARNVGFRTDVKNNVAFLLSKLAKYKDAHKYLDEARRLTSSSKDKVRTAQIDETRAQVLIAQKKFCEAESMVRNAVQYLRKATKNVC
jgi:hypothetical protein